MLEDQGGAITFWGGLFPAYAGGGASRSAVLSSLGHCHSHVAEIAADTDDSETSDDSDSDVSVDESSYYERVAGQRTSSEQHDAVAPRGSPTPALAPNAVAVPGTYSFFIAAAARLVFHTDHDQSCTCVDTNAQLSAKPEALGESRCCLSTRLQVKMELGPEGRAGRDFCLVTAPASARVVN